MLKSSVIVFKLLLSLGSLSLAPAKKTTKRRPHIRAPHNEFKKEVLNKRSMTQGSRPTSQGETDACFGMTSEVR